jgi:hypothetical protein
MSETVQVFFLLPDWIRQGLDSGSLERVGGVIRDVDGKRVRAWLSETGEIVQETAPEALRGQSVVALLQAQVVELGSDAAIHRKLDHIADVTERTLRSTLRLEVQVDDLREEQLTQLADPILEALDHIEAAAHAAESGALVDAATLGLARGRTRISRWLLARSGEQLVAEMALTHRLVMAVLLGASLEIGRVGPSGADRVLEQLGGALTEVEARVRAVRPSSRLPTSREVEGMRLRKAFLVDLGLALFTLGSSELRALGQRTPIALIDQDGVDRGLLIVVEEPEVVHVPR